MLYTVESGDRLSKTQFWILPGTAGMSRPSCRGQLLKVDRTRLFVALEQSRESIFKAEIERTIEYLKRGKRVAKFNSNQNQKFIHPS
jgi:hypothetical protein